MTKGNFKTKTTRTRGKEGKVNNPIVLGSNTTKHNSTLSQGTSPVNAGNFPMKTEIL